MGVKIGKGNVTFKDGSVFKGEWNENFANGIANLKYSNGDTFEG